MKTNRKSLLLFATVSMACTAPAALATDLYWDTDGTGTAGSGAATGTWGTDDFWSTDSTGANIGSPVLTAATTNLDDLFFSAGTNGTGGTVTVSESQTARKLTFQEGAITLSGGTLITLASGGISLATGAGDAVIDTALTATGAQIYDIGASRTLTVNGKLTGGIIKNGSGTMTLGGSLNHAISSWVVNEGILQLNGLSSGDALPGGTVNNGGTVKMGGGNGRVSNSGVFLINAGGLLDTSGTADLIGGISGAGSVSGTGGFLTLGSAGSLTFSGVISGTLGLIKRNGGDQILTGPNTYTGTTSVLNANATLTLGNSLAIQNSALATSSSILGTATTGLRTTVTTLTFGGLTGDKALSTVFRTDASGGSLATTALGGYSGLTALTLNPGTGVTHSYNADIGNGAGNMTLTKTGAGTQVFTANNTYTGATAISGGTLQLSGTGRLNSGNYAGAITLSNSAIFEKVSSGAQVLTGAITGTGTVKLDNSNGELLLRNASNNYTALNINAGRVFIQTNSGALPAAATVSLTGGTLNFDVAGTYNNAITVSSGANISARKLTTLSNVTLPGTGTVIFNNDDAVTTTLSITNGQTLTGSLSVQIGGGGTTANAVGGVTLSGQLTGSGSLLVASTGPVNNAKHTLTLSGTNDYAGTTTVNNGTLLINGNSSTATGAIAVNNGGTLGGTGRAGGAVTVAGGATLAPGASIESLAVASLNMAASSIFAYEISNNTATGADLLAVGSTVALTDVTLSLDSASLAALSGGGWNIGDKLTLLSYLGADITSGFTGYDDDTDYTFATNIWLFNYNDTEAGDNYGADAIAGGQNRFVTMTLIPEPNVAALLGACGILVLLRRRN